MMILTFQKKYMLFRIFPSVFVASYKPIMSSFSLLLNGIGIKLSPVLACVCHYMRAFKVLPMEPFVIQLIPMVMPMVPLALPILPLATNVYRWLPMVPLVKLQLLVKLPLVQLGGPYER